ncbi:MAG TPA: hypothetical protein VGL31_17745, partial [Xanthobacteraceae bacterium]
MRRSPRDGSDLIDVVRSAGAGIDPAGYAVLRNRDVVVGIKARLSNNVAGSNDLEALRRAQSVAAPLGLP